ncbi:MAG: hypothetical protein IPM31_17870 [Anaerolineae bacterium]|nr:hypothetical protein [Anaerolineae bacterium]
MVFFSTASQGYYNAISLGKRRPVPRIPTRCVYGVSASHFKPKVIPRLKRAFVREAFPWLKDKRAEAFAGSTAEIQFMVDHIFVVDDQRIAHNKHHVCRNGWRLFAARPLAPTFRWVWSKRSLAARELLTE